jgi:hypothetical protein
MIIRKRQTIGVMLIATSVSAAILIQAFTGSVLDFHTIHVDVISPNAIATDSVIIFHWRYVVPLAVDFVVGLVCCAWPTRKPPRIISSV